MRRNDTEPIEDFATNEVHHKKIAALMTAAVEYPLPIRIAAHYWRLGVRESDLHRALYSDAGKSLTPALNRVDSPIKVTIYNHFRDFERGVVDPAKVPSL